MAVGVEAIDATTAPVEASGFMGFNFASMPVAYRCSPLQKQRTRVFCAADLSYWRSPAANAAGRHIA